MLYKKNKSEKLNDELFKNPTAEYRGTPFWAWNCELDKDTLAEQIDYLKAMGFGGFHMHTRSGMATKYLSDDFMELIKFCTQKAKDKDMLAWLYDEDRWPSGSAGGMVTKDRRLRQKYIYMSTECAAEEVSKNEGIETGKPYLFACYDICLNEKGELVSYERIDRNQTAKGRKWYAYVTTAKERGWYNNQSYVDVLCDEAIDKFLEITHERYKEAVGEEFGKVVPAIFTDEPEFYFKNVLPYATDIGEPTMPWTTHIDTTYAEKYGLDLTLLLPEIFWELPNGKPSQARYFFHDHVCERFTRSFMDKCSKWCENNGIALTGHVMLEETLVSQTKGVGEAMRTYRSMGIPGMDMLCDAVELRTAKQVQSVVHQYGREAMTSELYGVTNWDFDFRGHKFQGDWQAAMGVTVRVPHLSWVSMKGSAKRDYPASINYQSPWFTEYPYVENHFARLNTALTRGKPLVKVGVIHPVESCWLHFGPSDVTSDAVRNLEESFKNITDWLAFGMIDFDYISEALLAEENIYKNGVLSMGEMDYSSVVVPNCETLRRSTLEKLKRFHASGGKLIFCGACPQYVDAVKCDDVRELYNSSKKAELSRKSLLDALADERFVEIRNIRGAQTDNLIHTLREDNGVLWLFVAHAKRPQNIDVTEKEDLRIKISGEYIPVLYDTISGEKAEMCRSYENGYTVIERSIYCFDSLLMQLEKGKMEAKKKTEETEISERIPLFAAADYSVDEPNVLLLDMAEFKLDEGEFEPTEEILRIDKKCRLRLGFPMADGCDVQPWAVREKEDASHFVTLKFTFESDVEVGNIMLAAEAAEELVLNGKNVIPTISGYYVDKSIKKYLLPNIEKGTNTLTVKMPISKRISVESCYLLGEFGVSVCGTDKRIIKKPDKLFFGDITRQGFPFFGGNIRYRTAFEMDKKGDISVFTGKYRGAMIKVLIDGQEKGNIVYPPYNLKVTDIEKGKHEIELILYGNRANTFASLHNYSGSRWFGPGHWYAEDGKGWCYEYLLKETGILVSPQIIVYNK
ncbi:MAG: hypothetical protein J6C82_03355 [Clostridia bacterium]|nr:hypothetical protein [Clostridia bacterium]MBP3360082.1 hypothetical protein [Clostridia bacterium]